MADYSKMTTDDFDTKRCPQCGQTKPRTEFSHQTYCRICDKAYKHGLIQRYADFRARHGQSKTIKQCGACLQEKPLTEFHKNPHIQDGRHTYCKVCHATMSEKRVEKYRQYWEEHDAYTDTPHITGVKRCGKCKQRLNLNAFCYDSRRWDGLGTRCRACTREDNQQSRYGGCVKADDSCAICGTLNDLCVDHDHKTGAFRGILCKSCNWMLGYAQDKPTILHKGADYLDQWASENPELAYPEDYADEEEDDTTEA